MGLPVDWSFAENYHRLESFPMLGFYDGTSAVNQSWIYRLSNGIQILNQPKNLLFVASVRGFLVKVYRIDENWNLTHFGKISDLEPE